MRSAAVAGAFGSGASHGIGVNYSSGPFSIGGLVSHRNFLVGNTYQGDDYYMAGIGFKFGALNVSGGFMSEDQANAATTHTVTHNAFGGLSYQISPVWTFTGGYYQTQVSNDKASRRGLSIISLAYALSKRTVLYGEMDYTKYKNALVSTLNPTGKKFTDGGDDRHRSRVSDCHLGAWSRLPLTDTRDRLHANLTGRIFSAVRERHASGPPCRRELHRRDTVAAQSDSCRPTPTLTRYVWQSAPSSFSAAARCEPRRCTHFV